ncbi:MAG: hypothetical protein AAGB19_22290, partial [Cyanobacteria bacterium P01_F01_bin.3]
MATLALDNTPTRVVSSIHVITTPNQLPVEVTVFQTLLHMISFWAVPLCRPHRKRFSHDPDASCTTTVTPAESSDATSSGPEISAITDMTMCAHIPVFLEHRATTRCPMKLDNCNEAPRSMISYAVFNNYLTPQGYRLRPRPAGGFLFTAGNGTQLPTTGCLR